ncbi:MAG: aspartate--tRNA ligase [Filifactoraceae bacterium]
METLSGLKRSNYCNDLRIENVGKEVTLMGWVQRARKLGGLIFVDLRDRTGICQVNFDENVNKDIFEKAGKLGSEYVIAVVGTVSERSSKNPNLQTGDIEIMASELRILSESETPPIYIKDDDIVSENLRLKYRYLDLRKSKMQQNFRLRHEVARLTRNFLSNEGFLEIETPILGKPTPEGARDYLVPSRVSPGSFYGLPQSPQLFKQLFMVSGMDRYFQIAKCFRDEDLRADRQPEFTQIDCEMSFVEMEDVMEVMERLIQYVFKEAMGYEIELPLQRMKYAEAMNKYGSDKPDLRVGFEITDVTNIVRNSGFGVFDNAPTVRGINISGCEEKFTRKGISALEEVAKTYGAKGLAWVKITKDGVNSPISKFIEEQVMDNLIKEMNGNIGDILLFVADKKNIALTAIGNVRLEAAKSLDLLNPDEFKFLYVTEFPLFEYDEEEDRLVSMHHPFTSPLDEDLNKLDTNPADVNAKAYDMVLNGVELGGGSIRIYNSELQSKMFKMLGLSEEEAWDKFGFLLEAFKYGTPPHGGLAFGLDRLLMLMLKESSIREVIAFPKTQNASCPLTNAPAATDSKALEELGISVKKG